ncbi:sensor histidine kinase [Clostridium oryzae]|uniref:histidine kinase n=1 Tax=Clostridium oryzae TaxID=1450648 RepID=A0A1V4IVF6_9CLOT|nr:HAMP domain-containing sensor histidine kinase [Clostridium oryzae]OPJ63810.1 histidine protein kinase DivJ [Clostridium oryzae]
MKSFIRYISKHLISFASFIIVLILTNVLVYGFTFQRVIIKGYGDNSPETMLKEASSAATMDGISDNTRQKLKKNHIWAMFLSQTGKSVWSVDVPSDIPNYYTLQDVAVFSKGYLHDYPVFVCTTKDGLLVLGYPKDSYTKLTSNYFPIRAIKMLPFYITGMLAVDFLLLFFAYYFSKRKIIKNTEPIISSIETLSNGKPVSLSIDGELSEVASSVNKASQILSRQNEARANWISGVSHDIRTPLSMIMGYAGRIAEDDTVNSSIKGQAKIIQKQSVKIKDLVQDLNLVSKLEYEMHPLRKEDVRISKLLRSYVAELLNTGIPDTYSVEIEITADAETAALECDARLISRAINNLVQNSINHNPQGCGIKLSLDYSEAVLSLTVADDGIGLSREKLQELKEKPHYMESIDERLDLRHGLGLLLVREIVEVHKGEMSIESKLNCGCRTILKFRK